MDVEAIRALPGHIKHSEEVSSQLEHFAKDPSATPPSAIPAVIKEISITGLLCYSWEAVRAAIVSQIDVVLNHFQATMPNPAPEEALLKRKTNLYNGINVFEEAPFTVQRICEILDNKGQGYCSVDKLLNALEKLTRVNTVQPKLSPRSFESSLTSAANSMAEQKQIQHEDLQRQKEVEEQKKHIQDADLMEID